MADTSLKINPAKSSDIQFDVTIQGLDSSLPEVRFVITSESDGCNHSFRCVKVKGEKTKWMATLPKLEWIGEDQCNFHLEVIVDGYYFEPAHGKVVLLSNPDVKFETAASRPVVEAAFSVNQSLDEVEITGQYAPTNSLLVPEEEPKQSAIKSGEQGDVYKMDNNVDRTRLKDIGSKVTPGPGSTNEPQEGNNDPEENSEEDDTDIIEPFDPRRVAQNIMRSTVGSGAKAPTTKGSLFKRDAHGRPMIAGLDTPEQREAKAANAAKVRDILNQ